MAIPLHFTARLVAEPELRFTPAGLAVANFRIANSDRVKNEQTGEWSDGDSIFLTCNAWRDMAENVVETVTKGDLVVISGKLKQRDYEKDGQKRTVYEVAVDDIGKSMKWKDKNAKPKQSSSSSDEDVPF